MFRRKPRGRRGILVTEGNARYRYYDGSTTEYGRVTFHMEVEELERVGDLSRIKIHSVTSSLVNSVADELCRNAKKAQPEWISTNEVKWIDE
jgi:hypothetical protein